MKKFIPFALIAVCGTALFAEESSLAKEAAEQKSSMEYSVTTSGAYYLEAEHKTGSSHFSGVSGPYDGVEAVTEFDATYTMPFLNGDDELTADNHLALKLGLELSPVTVAPVASVTFSPIAFLEFAVGGTAGTGWNISDWFQGMAAYNEAKPEYKDLTPFAHWYLYGWASGCFMFDLAALWEGDWHHVVMTATYKAGYQKLTGTDSDVWLWQASDGMASGWVYEQEYFLGYQMPLTVSMIGVGTTVSGHYKSSDYGKFSKNYDGDFRTIDIWPMAEITLNKTNQIYVVVDFTTRRSFKEKYEDSEHEPLMTKTGREWLLDAIALQWKHVF